MSMTITDAQKRQFAEEGYLKIPGAVPKSMIETSLRAVNYSIGNIGIGGEDPSRNRSGFFCAELLDAPFILDMYNKTPVMQIAESLMGKGNVLPVERAKTYPRFPLPLGQEPSPPRGHIDGIGSGTNGTAKGDYKRSFTAFAVVYLVDVPESYSGNFTVWPQSHRFFANYFTEHGHEVLANGMPRPNLPKDPIMITGNAGDLILAHHQVVHGACLNASPNVRLATITRLKHKHADKIGKDAYTDIWREWSGVRDVLR